jgi:hypothetical protein
MSGVETEEFRRARKQRYRDAMKAGVNATLEKGRLMDEMHNRPPGEFIAEITEVAQEHVRTVVELLEAAREIAESIPVEILVERDDGSIVADKVTKVYIATSEVDVGTGTINVTVDTEQALSDIKELEAELDELEHGTPAEKAEEIEEIESVDVDVEEPKKEEPAKAEENATVSIEEQLAAAQRLLADYMAFLKDKEKEAEE